MPCLGSYWDDWLRARDYDEADSLHQDGRFRDLPRNVGSKIG